MANKTVIIKTQDLYQLLIECDSVEIDDSEYSRLWDHCEPSITLFVSLEKDLKTFGRLNSTAGLIHFIGNGKLNRYLVNESFIIQFYLRYGA